MVSSSLRSSRVAFAFGSVATALLLAGCGGGDEFNTAPVSGKVTFNGKPVTSGTIMLRPISEGDSNITGKGAAAPVQDDGSFVLTTYEQGDGAIVGKHRVSYVPSMETKAIPAGGHGSPIVQSSFAGAKPKVPEVEIKPGDNTLNIELVK